MQATARADAAASAAAGAKDKADKADARANALSEQLVATVQNFEAVIAAANEAQSALVQRTQRHSVAGRDSEVLQSAAAALQQAIADRGDALAAAKNAASATSAGLKVPFQLWPPSVCLTSFRSIVANIEPLLCHSLCC